MNYQIEILDNYKMVHVRNIGKYGSPENFQMMENLKKWISHNHLEEDKKTEGIIGIAQGNPQLTPVEQCRFDLMLFTDKDFSQDSQVNMGDFEGGKYAVFTVTHTTEAVDSFWKNIGKTISQNHLDIIANAPILERYKEEEGEDKICEFLIPMK
ncbi:GyrI-like domain-containing protein [Tetragenococcus halophilus]|nr:GyrI-like domain-containing protein [Tetragenococcus halophilus]